MSALRASQAQHAHVVLEHEAVEASLVRSRSASRQMLDTLLAHVASPVIVGVHRDDAPSDRQQREGVARNVSAVAKAIWSVVCEQPTRRQRDELALMALQRMIQASTVRTLFYSTTLCTPMIENIP